MGFVNNSSELKSTAYVSIYKLVHAMLKINPTCLRNSTAVNSLHLFSRTYEWRPNN